MEQKALRLGLTWKFFIFFVGIVIISGAISCCINFNYEGHAHLRSLREKGISFARYVADLSKDPLITQQSMVLDEIVKSVNVDPEMAYALIYDMNDVLRTSFFSSVNLTNDRVRSVLDRISKNSSLQDSIQAIRNDKNISEVAVSVVLNSEKIGKVVIGLSDTRIHAVILKSLCFLILGNLTGCLIAFLLVLLLQRLFIRPIIRLSSLVKGVAQEKNYSLRALVDSSDELGELSAGVNDMLEQIQRRDSELGQYHENLEKLVAERTAELALLSDRQRIILESAGEGILGFDEAGRHVFVNNLACELLGLAPDELLGKSIHDVWQHSALDGSRCYSDNCRTIVALREGRAISVDDEIFWRSDQLSFPVEYIMSPMKKDDKVIGAVLIFHDISARRAVERDLFNAKELAEAANRAKSEFLASMTHEIRTPMNAILGFGHLLRRTPLNEKQQNYLNTIVSSGQLLINIINDILDLTKVASGRLIFEQTPFDLYQVIQDAVHVVEPQVMIQVIRMIVDVDPELRGLFLGDSIRIRQVLINLLGNAAKFTSQGEIVFTVRPVEKIEGRCRILFSIKDTGIGIAQDKLKTIFEPFIQADMSTTRKYGGTGLGLSIAKSIVEGMGGKIEVRSKVGEGSEFMFTLVLPKAPVQEVLELNKFAGVSEVQGVKVLVVENNEANQNLMREFLNELGCQAEYVGDGREALERLRQFRFDLCLMDVQMPVMGGDEAIQIIRAEISRDLPVIALTAAAMVGDKERILKLGMTDFLSKPIFFETLRDKIKQYTAGYRSE